MGDASSQVFLNFKGVQAEFLLHGTNPSTRSLLLPATWKQLVAITWGLVSL